MPNTPDYFDAYSTFAMTRSEGGVLTLRFHGEDDGPAAFSGPMQRDFPRALYEIAEDRDNRVLVLTGTGDSFMTDVDGGSLGDLTKPSSWDRIFTRGTVTMQRLVDLQMPIIAEVLPLARVPQRAQELGEDLASRPQMLTRFISVTMRQRLSRCTTASGVVCTRSPIMRTSRRDRAFDRTIFAGRRFGARAL